MINEDDVPTILNPLYEGSEIDLKMDLSSKNIDELYKKICNIMEKQIRLNGLTGIELEYEELRRSDYDTLVWALVHQAKYKVVSSFQETVDWTTMHGSVKSIIKISL